MMKSVYEQAQIANIGQILFALLYNIDAKCLLKSSRAVHGLKAESRPLRAKLKGKLKDEHERQ